MRSRFNYNQNMTNYRVAQSSSTVDVEIMTLGISIYNFVSRVLKCQLIHTRLYLMYACFNTV